MLKKGYYTTAFNLTVLVAGLGYFIDTFDFFLYNSMRVQSLTELGLSGDALMHAGIVILNCQVFGALIGSFFWGILGDRIGRKKALLGSILLYSLGMVFSGLVPNVPAYALARFITGFGVAGEVGLGATLVGETIQSSKRTYALMFFTVMGVLGTVAAGMSIEIMSWRMSCFAGGGFGLLLLLLRRMLFESQLFSQLVKTDIRRGSLRDLLGNFGNLKKYLFCVPILGSNFFVTGILMTLAPEIGKATGVLQPIKANIALALYFFSAAFGDAFGAWLSEVFKSRRLVAGVFILGNALLSLVFLQTMALSTFAFYVLCVLFGLMNLWAMSATIIIEQFPTKLRATATTSNINFSRATVIVMNLALLALKPLGITNALMIIGVGVFCFGPVLCLAVAGNLWTYVGKLDLIYPIQTIYPHVGIIYVEKRFLYLRFQFDRPDYRSWLFHRYIRFLSLQQHACSKSDRAWLVGRCADTRRNDHPQHADFRRSDRQHNLGRSR